jgi:type I restriction enzyme S subunit
MFDYTSFDLVSLDEIVAKKEVRDPRKTPQWLFHYVDIASVSNKTFQIKNGKQLVGADAPSRARKVIRNNDVIIATTRPYLKSIAMVPTQLDGQIGSTGFCVLRPTEKVLSDWLFYCAISDDLLHQITPKMRGANYPAVTDKDILSAKIPLPPLAKQRRIVARIKECMERVEEIEALRTESYNECSIVLRAYYHDLYRGLVQRYTTMPLADAGIALGGGTPSRKRNDFWNGHIPWISPKEMKRRDFLNATQNITEAAVEGSSTKLITEPSVLFVVRGMILSHTLPVAVNRVPVTINQDMKAITPRGNINVDFLAAMLRGSERELLSKVEVAGHGTRRLQTAHWSALPVPIVSEQDQAAIVSEIQNMEAVADALIRDVELDEIHLLRESILRKAFAGEL